MFACPTLETERLTLRPFHDSDLDRYFEIHGSAQVRESLHIPATYSRDDAWAAMAGVMGQWALRGTGNWALEERATGALVGRAGTHNPSRAEWPGIEIGWTLDPAHWGKGFATEAGRAAVDWAFANQPVDELFSCILPSNSPSQAVATRLGFALREQRIIPFLPGHPLGIWVLPRPQ